MSSTIQTDLFSPEEFTFTNWDESLSCRPAKYAQPESEAELQECITGSEGVVRVFGAGHSWSPIALSNDVMLNLDRLNNVVAVDADRKTLTVQAGIRLRDLVVRADERGLALKNLGAIMAQSIAGATSAGTHGTGLKFGSIHTQIAALKLIRADGAPISLNAESDPDVMKAARIALGTLGVLSEVTLQCVDAHNLEYKAWPLGFDAALAQLPQLLQENEHLRLYWFPGVDQFYVNVMNETDRPADPRSPVVGWFQDVFVRQFVMGHLWEIGAEFPSAVELINRFEERVGFTRDDHVATSYLALTTPMPPRHVECEYAVPLEAAVEALQSLRKLVKDDDLHANVPAEIRFVQADSNYLSPCYGRDTCYIGAYASAGNLEQPYINAFEPVMKALGGRPHWGKLFTLTHEEVRQMYPEFPKFDAVRRAFDPNGRFLNPYLAKLLTP